MIRTKLKFTFALWLICLQPAITAIAQHVNSFEGFLVKNKISLQARINQYDPQRYNLLIHQQQFSVKEGVSVQQVKSSKWEIKASFKAVEDDKCAQEYILTFKCIEGALTDASLSATIAINHWDAKNYVLLPAAAYNGNKYTSRKLRYSPKLYDVKDIGPNIPIIINDVPKLNEADGVSRIQERSGSLSTPAVGYVAHQQHKGLWMLTHQGNQLGDYGIDVEESRDRTKAYITITSPVVREQFLYKICDSRVPSWDEPKNFKKGDEISISFKLYDFEAQQPQDLFDKLTSIRKSYIPDTQQKDVLPFSACFTTLEEKFNRYNFVPEHGYYSVGLRENYLQDWQIGWTGGMISTYPLLVKGNAQTKANVIRNFDWLFANGISPSGFYWDAGEKGTIWYGGDIRNPQSKNWHLIRKSGDAVWYILKQFSQMEKMGITVKEEWKAKNRLVCNAFVNLWNQNRQLGQFIDSQTGKISVGGSSSGAIVPAALALASVYYQEPKYLKVAQEIGDYLNENFTKKGISCGGPGDALQSFDSESSYALVESYTALYEYSKDKKWLQIAQNAANQFASWVVSYNYQFPDTSAYHKLNIKTTGSVYANIQNKHTAPNICTYSGLALLKLYQYTQKPFYLDLLKDIAHGNTQYLAHPQNPIPQTPNGFMSERVNMTDWEGKGSIGYVLPLTTWAETSLMLTAIEIPGVYIEPQKEVFTAFDNIQVKKLKSNQKQLVLRFSNTTKLEADVNIVSAIAAKQGLKEQQQLISLVPGAYKDLIFKKK